jgi:hypothetical protein
MTQELTDGSLRFPRVIWFTDGRDSGLGDGFHRNLAIPLMGANPRVKHRGASPGYPVGIGLNLRGCSGRAAVAGKRTDISRGAWRVQPRTGRSGEQMTNQTQTNLHRAQTLQGQAEALGPLQRRRELGQSVSLREVAAMSQPSTKAGADERPRTDEGNRHQTVITVVSRGRYRPSPNGDNGELPSESSLPNGRTGSLSGAAPSVTKR